MNKEIDTMVAYLTTECGNTAEEMFERMSVIEVYLCRSGEMLAEAKRILRKKKSSEISATIIAIAKEQCLSAKVQNALLDSICEEESYLVDRLDRLNSTCTHQLDSLRSKLSYEKESIRLNNTGY